MRTALWRCGVVRDSAPDPVLRPIPMIGSLRPGQVGVHAPQQPHQAVEIPELQAADGPSF